MVPSATKPFLVPAILVALLGLLGSPDFVQAETDPASDPLILGKPLSHWLSQATGAEESAGILSLIDSEKYAGDGERGRVTSERSKLSPGSEIESGAMASLADWPQFHGPQRNSVCLERGLLPTWPPEGPKLLWQLEGLGRGFSGLAIAQGRFFTMADRPIDGGREAQFVVAYNIESRRELWAIRIGLPFKTGPRCTPTVDGHWLYALGTEGDLVCLRSSTGEIRWQKNLADDLGGKIMSGWKFSESPLVDGNRIACNVANITAPVVHGNHVFVTTAYNTGSTLLEVTRDGENFRAEEVYFLGPRDFLNHHGGIVLVGEHIYGGHGANRGDPACVELATGNVVWKHRAPARGSAGVLYADGHLIFRYDRGDVLLIEASAEAFRVKGQFRPPTGEGPAWAHPVIHRGKLYLRHGSLLCCYDLRSL